MGFPVSGTCAGNQHRLGTVRGATMWQGDQGNMVVSQNRGSDFDSKILQSLLPTADFPSGREIE